MPLIHGQQFQQIHCQSEGEKRPRTLLAQEFMMRLPVKTQSLAVGAILLFLTMIGVTTTAKPFVCADASGTNCALAPGKSLLKGQSAQSPVPLSQKTDFDYESTSLIANILYRRLSRLSNTMTPNGANGVNVRWESTQAGDFYIEAQRYGEELVIGGLIKNDMQAIQAGFKMFDWGFARQEADGSFKGTDDPFHSTSFFVQAVARTLLVIQQSPQSEKYADKVAHYKPLVHRAARWMIKPDVWKRGTKHNQPYTHRRYLVAAALGLTGKLTGDQDLINYSRKSIVDGLSLQRPDGNNPEKGGYDSSYQMVGLVYAQRWVTYFPKDSLTPKVKAMIDKALAWEQTRILPTGEISRDGNTRSAGQETGRNGKFKKIDHRSAVRGFAYWASVTGDPQAAAIARQIAHYYF